MESALNKLSSLTRKQEPPKQDLLLRLFESQWFSDFMCLQYLYTNPQPGVEDYLANKLFEMPEPSIERYLLQFVYLAVSRPGSPLERTIIALCSKSFSIALKASDCPAFSHAQPTVHGSGTGGDHACTCARMFLCWHTSLCPWGFACTGALAAAGLVPGPAQAWPGGGAAGEV